MKSKRSVLLLLLPLLCIPTYSVAQAWSGIIDPSRAINWSNVGIPGGIPARTTICATLTSSAGTVQINAALATCPANEVVFLSAGTYTITAGINFSGHSNVTLRGAGPTQTILKFTGGDVCGGLGGDICAISSVYDYADSVAVLPGGANIATWSGGYSKGSNSITLSGIGSAGIPVGEPVILDQANDTSDTDGYLVCDVSYTCHEQGETTSASGQTISGLDYDQAQVVTVTGVSGSTYTISPGLYANNWRSSQTPRVWWSPQITQVGVENMTVDNTGSGTSIASGIYFYNCYECWVKNVRSIDGNRNHVWLYQSARDVVRDSYFYGTQNAAEESYGIETLISSDDLIENNIFDTIASPIMFDSGAGDVVGYNYSVKNYYNVSPAWMQASYSSHDAGNDMNLFEGNEFNGIFCDDTHGTSGLETYFRNQLAGSQSGKTEDTNAVMLMYGCRGFNIVGNVLGTSGYDTQYQVTPSTGSTSACDTTVYQIGWDYSECGRDGSAPPANDSLVASTLLRWGNYDTVNGSTQWNSSEIPKTAVPYINANAVPSSETLPASFYLASQPPFWATKWGTPPWPSIGPDVSGGNISGVGGHANMIPAQLCYVNTPADSTYGNGVLLYDASTCYPAAYGTPPAPPTDLTATPN
ncbi:MAG: hypothetical protein ACRD2B_14800 [Terriglobia bacterium]